MTPLGSLHTKGTSVQSSPVFCPRPYYRSPLSAPNKRLRTILAYILTSHAGVIVNLLLTVRLTANAEVIRTGDSLQRGWPVVGSPVSFHSYYIHLNNTGQVLNHKILIFYLIVTILTTKYCVSFKKYSLSLRFASLRNQLLYVKPVISDSVRHSGMPLPRRRH